MTPQGKILSMKFFKNKEALMKISEYPKDPKPENCFTAQQPSTLS